MERGLPSYKGQKITLLNMCRVIPRIISSNKAIETWGLCAVAKHIDTRILAQNRLGNLQPSDSELWCTCLINQPQNSHFVLCSFMHERQYNKFRCLCPFLHLFIVFFFLTKSLVNWPLFLSLFDFLRDWSSNIPSVHPCFGEDFGLLLDITRTMFYSNCQGVGLTFSRFITMQHHVYNWRECDTNVIALKLTPWGG